MAHACMAICSTIIKFIFWVGLLGGGGGGGGHTPLPPPPPPPGSATAQKHCEFRVLKLQNNKEFQPQNAMPSSAPAHVLQQLMIGFSTTSVDVRLTHSRSLSL